MSPLNVLRSSRGIDIFFIVDGLGIPVSLFLCMAREGVLWLGSFTAHSDEI